MVARMPRRRRTRQGKKFLKMGARSHWPQRRHSAGDGESEGVATTPNWKVLDIAIGVRQVEGINCPFTASADSKSQSTPNRHTYGYRINQRPHCVVGREGFATVQGWGAAKLVAHLAVKGFHISPRFVSRELSSERDCHGAYAVCEICASTEGFEETIRVKMGS